MEELKNRFNNYIIIQEKYKLFNINLLLSGNFKIFDNLTGQKYNIFIENNKIYIGNIEYTQIDNIFDHIIVSNDFNRYRYIETNNSNNININILISHLEEFKKNKLYNMSYNFRYINNYINIIDVLCNKKDYNINDYFIENSDIEQINDMTYNILNNRDNDVNKIYNHYMDYKNKYNEFVDKINNIKL